MTPAALAAMLADGLRRAPQQTEATPRRYRPTRACCAPIRWGRRSATTRCPRGQALPAPRFDDKTQLPAPAAYRADEMPAYNAAELPAQADPMTLDQVYMMALQNDPQLRGAYQELQAVGYGVMAARCCPA